MHVYHFSVQCTIILLIYQRIIFIYFMTVVIKLYSVNRTLKVCSCNRPEFYDDFNSLHHVESKIGIIYEYVCCLRTLSTVKIA
jgi:hypothetical protein